MLLYINKSIYIYILDVKESENMIRVRSKYREKTLIYSSAEINMATEKHTDDASNINTSCNIRVYYSN